MKPKIDIETTIPSYLTAWPSQDPIRAAHHQLRRQWWDGGRFDFDLYVSEVVILEASSGDPVAAADRLRALDGIPVLKAAPEAKDLSADLVGRMQLPPKAALDAVHIAIAVVNGMDYLLTWNCTHIANTVLRPAIDDVCRSRGYSAPVIWTPEGLSGGARS